MNLHIEGLTPIHFLLAYAGMLIHVLMKLARVFNMPEFTFRIFIRKSIIPLIISIIGIPVLLIIATDPSVKDFLPINNVTAMLAGWQTQSMFKTIFAVFGNKKAPSNSNGTTPTDNGTGQDI